MASDNDQPVYIAHGSGPGFTDLDGFFYVDFNASDMAMFCGHANPSIVRAISEQAARSTQFLLPTEASIDVAEELARRYPVSHWQFTLAATQANTEAIRLARAATGREVVLLFHGHYHGHFEEGLVDLDDGTTRALQRGLSRGVTGRVRIAEFNDAAMLEEALAPGDVALVLTEPAMSNGLHLLLPQDDWHAVLREPPAAHGTLLAVDETHTHVVGRGGATALYGLEPDIVSIGKAVAGGVPMGTYGVTAGAGLPARRLPQHRHRRHAVRQPAVGGGGEGGADRGADRGGLHPYHRARRGAGRRHRGGDRGCRAAVDGDPVRAADRPVVRAGAAHRRDALALTDSELTGLMRVWLATAGSGRRWPAPGRPCRSLRRAPTSTATSRPTRAAGPAGLSRHGIGSGSRGEPRSTPSTPGQPGR